MVTRGWLLDLYADEADGLVLWLLDEDGARRRLCQDFPITFYAHGPFPRLRALWRCLTQEALAGVHPSQVRLGRVTRQDLFAGELELLAVTVANPALQPRLFWQVARRFPDLAYYDADIPLGLRYAAVIGLLGELFPA